MRRRIAVGVVAAGLMVTVPAPGVTQNRMAAHVDGRDSLLAALGSLTIECLGTVGPSNYSAESGILTRTFDACRAGDSEVLADIDALLAVQTAPQGRADGLAEHYTSRWNAFVASFPFDRIGECPTWRLLNVLDAPTSKRVQQLTDRRRTDAGSPPIGKENHRYRVSSELCGLDRSCAVRHAALCAGGFGPQFLVERDAERGRMRWTPHGGSHTTSTRLTQRIRSCSPVTTIQCLYWGDPPGSLYAAVERVGEKCSQLVNGKHYTDRVLQLIDCTDGDGWYCMTYCFEGPYSTPQPGAAAASARLAAAGARLARINDERELERGEHDASWVLGR